MATTRRPMSLRLMSTSATSLHGRYSLSLATCIIGSTCQRVFSQTVSCSAVLSHQLYMIFQSHLITLISMHYVQ